MPFTSEIVIAAIIGGLFGVGGTLMTLFANGKLNNASTANQVSLAWSQLIKPYQDQIVSQNVEIAKQKALIAQQELCIVRLEHRVELLETQLELLGAVPKTKRNNNGI